MPQSTNMPSFAWSAERSRYSRLRKVAGWAALLFGLSYFGLWASNQWLDYWAVGPADVAKVDPLDLERITMSTYQQLELLLGLGGLVALGSWLLMASSGKVTGLLSVLLKSAVAASVVLFVWLRIETPDEITGPEMGVVHGVLRAGYDDIPWRTSYHAPRFESAASPPEPSWASDLPGVGDPGGGTWSSFSQLPGGAWLAGFSQGQGTFDLGLPVRLDAAGAVDAEYSRRAKATLDAVARARGQGGELRQQLNVLRADSQGRALVVLTSAADRRSALIALAPDGSLDADFRPPNAEIIFLSKVQIDAEGLIYLQGTFGSGGQTNRRSWLILEPDGQPLEFVQTRRY